MEVLITGGLGNLGIWLTDYFLERGHSVTVLARKERVKLLHSNYRFRAADVTLSSSLLSVIDQRYDLCIHASSYNEHFQKGYERRALEVNALGTEYLCQALQVHGVGRLIYLSTFHVYGSSEGVITEDSRVAPTNDYGLTHYFAEKYIEKHHKNLGMSYVILRLTNSYGCPRRIDTDKWYLLLNDLCFQANLDGNVQLTSNGRAQRDFIWMRDVATVVHEVSQTDECLNQIFNLSSGMTFSALDVANYVKNSYRAIDGGELDVLINESDKSAPRCLSVSNRKLADVIPLNFNNCFRDEAEKILMMLRSNRE